MADIELAFEPPLARVRLNRPERRNAMNGAMWRALAEIAAEIEARSDIKVVLVEGAGGHFCAGADISEFDVAFGAIEPARAYLDGIELGLSAWTRLDRPTIAVLEGSAIGGGLAVALCCDLRFCAEDAHLAVPPAKLGLLYGPVETRRLAAVIGVARAKDLLFSARRVPTDEALAIGLIDRRLPAADLRAAAEAYARELAGLSQTSIRGAKRMVEASLAGDSVVLRAEVEVAAIGADFREGRTAYVLKRKPNFA